MRGWVARRFTLIVCATLLPVACRSVTSPAHPARPVTASPPARSPLERDIDAILVQPALARAYWGVLVKSLRSGTTLYALNAGKLMMPASNMKIVTLAAAADRLGWDYSYTTRFVSAGPIDGSVLQ